MVTRTIARASRALRFYLSWGRAYGAEERPRPNKREPWVSKLTHSLRKARFRARLRVRGVQLNPPPGLVPSGRVRMLAVVWEVSLVFRGPAPHRNHSLKTAPSEIALRRSFRPPNRQYGLQDGFSDSQDGIKTAQDGPRRLKRPQDSLKTAHEAPKTAQESSKRPSKRA